MLNNNATYGDSGILSSCMIILVAPRYQFVYWFKDPHFLKSAKTGRIKMRLFYTLENRKGVTWNIMVL